MATRCTRHVHRGPQDFRPNGECIHCARLRQKRYRDSCRSALRQMRAVEAQIA